LWQNGLGQQSQGIGVAITKPWHQSYRTFVGRTEKVCASKETYKPDSVTPSLSGGMGQNVPNLYVGSLWKATWNVWPTLNNLKAMLPNTNWVYANFWPTGNVMKEIKAELNHSLSYYSDISHSVLILTDRRQGIFNRIKYQELWQTELKCVWLRCM
jgi:hypothetical protein